MTNGKAKISKKSFYSMGGLSNPNLYRKHTGATWYYYKIL